MRVGGARFLTGAATPWRISNKRPPILSVKVCVHRCALRRLARGAGWKPAQSPDGDNEEFFFRMRRAEIGQHHRLADIYLARYA